MFHPDGPVGRPACAGDGATWLILSRKGAKDRAPSGVRSSGMKPTPRAGRGQVSRTTLERKLKARERELSEALEQQRATSEGLQVIGSSPDNVQPVFEAMVGNAARLCEAGFAAVARFERGLLHLVAMNNLR